MGIIVACLPASRIVVLRYLPNKLSIHLSRFTDRHRLTTDRSSKGRSTATWASEKRQAHAQRAAQPSDTPDLDEEPSWSRKVSVSSPAGLKTFYQPAEFSRVTSGSDRRESDLPLVAGVDTPQPVVTTPWRPSIPDDEHRQASGSRPNDGRIWAAQHICVSTEPSRAAPRSLFSREDEESNLPGSESV